MIIHKKFAAFTLIELLVVISIIAILAGIALPVFSQVQVRGAQTKALSNAKQIGLALKVYAGDNNGVFPSYTLSNGAPTTTAVKDSNTAFAQLFPQDLTNEAIFWLAKSKECNAAPPDNVIDNPLPDTPVNTLAKGENHWAYVTGLTDTSNSQFPLIADAFNGDPSQGTHNYIADPTVEGGVWTGTRAVVIRVDISGNVEKCTPTAAGAAATNSSTSQVLGAPPATTGAAAIDLFDNSGKASNWLGTSNITVNPK